MLLRDDQWERMEPLLSGKSSDCGVTGKDNRLFLEAVLWICRTGAPWRDLPKDFGNWHTVFTRYNRWSKKGHWQTIFESLSQDADFEYLMIDGSIARVHQHGAPKKTLKKRKLLENLEGV
jgi:transposase